MLSRLKFCFVDAMLHNKTYRDNYSEHFFVLSSAEILLSCQKSPLESICCIIEVIGIISLNIFCAEILLRHC